MNIEGSTKVVKSPLDRGSYARAEIRHTKSIVLRSKEALQKLKILLPLGKSSCVRTWPHWLYS